MSVRKRAVFLDRDGVVNQSVVRGGKPYPPSCLEGLVVLPGVDEAVRRLHEAGFLCILATNQPDVVTGVQTLTEVERMHAYLRQRLGLDDIFACYHVESHHCGCRKPRPGMLLAAANRYDIDLDHSFMVGDRWRDIDAGHAAHCRTFFIDYGYGEDLRSRPDHVVSSLAQAGEIIVSL